MTRGRQRELVEQVMQRISSSGRSSDPTLQPDDVLHWINRQKASSKAPSQFSSTLLGDYYELYETLLQQQHHGYLDFAGLIVEATRILVEHEAQRNSIQQQITCLLIDELQDTSISQMEFFCALCGDTIRAVTACGDDDQILYSFRGANASVFVTFQLHFGAEIKTLETNYRSTSNIVKAASSLIRHNVFREDKHINTQNTQGTKIRIMECSNDAMEAHLVATAVHILCSEPCKRRSIVKDIPAGIMRNQILNMLIGNPAHCHHHSTASIDVIVAQVPQFAMHDVAILCRVNNGLHAFESALTLKGMSVRRFGTKPLYEREEVQDILAHLSLLADTGDNRSFLRIASKPSCNSLMKSALEYIKKMSVERVSSLWDTLDYSMRAGFPALACESICADHRQQQLSIALFTQLAAKSQHPMLVERVTQLLKPEQCNWLRQFYQRILTLRRLVESKKPIAEIIEYIAHHTDYKTYLQQLNERDANKKEKNKLIQSRQFNISQLIQDAIEFENENANYPSHAMLVAKFVDSCILSTCADDEPVHSNIHYSGEKSVPVSQITLSTVHQAKGLEWKCVFLVKCNEGVLPTIHKSLEKFENVSDQQLSQTSHMEDERRIAFVAMTRAQTDLYCTYVTERKVSRFLHEMEHTCRLLYQFYEGQQHIQLPSSTLQRNQQEKPNSQQEKPSSQQPNKVVHIKDISELYLPLPPSPSSQFHGKHDVKEPTSSPPPDSLAPSDTMQTRPLADSPQQLNGKRKTPESAKTKQQQNKKQKISMKEQKSVQKGAALMSAWLQKPKRSADDNKDEQEVRNCGLEKEKNSSNQIPAKKKSFLIIRKMGSK